MNRISICRDNRGFALIITILIVSLIVVLTLRFSRSVQSDLYASANFKDGIRLGYTARSGFNCALALLAADGASTEVDSLQELWADSEQLSAYSGTLFETSAFELEIVDLCGKIQINRLIGEQGHFKAAQRNLLLRFLSAEPFKMDPDEAGRLIDAIKDWIDADDEPTRFGAESAYYQGVDPPCRCNNAPLTAIGELLSVKGMTRERLHGTDKIPGISRYITVYGDGRINMNTADPIILKALSEDIDQPMIEAMLQYRMDEDNELSDPGWYKNVPGMAHIQIDPSLITTESRYFMIQSTGVSGAQRKNVLGTTRRGDKNGMDILSWRIE